jgi:TP53 regulating kinase-like protein
MIKAKESNIPVPTVYHTDKTNFFIYMEFIEGDTLRNVLNSGVWSLEQSKYALFGGGGRGRQRNKYQFLIFTGKQKYAELGEMLAKLHDLNIVHEDLTSSNMLVRKETDEIVILSDLIISYHVIFAYI